MTTTPGLRTPNGHLPRTPGPIHPWLENLTGADIHNIDEIRPEWQERAIGDGILMARPDLFGGTMLEASTLRVRIVEPGRALATTSAAGDTSAWVLVPIDAGSTRLIVRARIGSTGSDRISDAVDDLRRWLIWDPMRFIMQHRMMLGNRARAQGHQNPPLALDLVARAGWLVAG